MSRDPQTFAEAIDVAVQETENEKLKEQKSGILKATTEEALVRKIEVDTLVQRLADLEVLVKQQADCLRQKSQQTNNQRRTYPNNFPNYQQGSYSNQGSSNQTGYQNNQLGYQPQGNYWNQSNHLQGNYPTQAGGNNPVNLQGHGNQNRQFNCYNCCLAGHYARDCQSPPTCTFCKKAGHIASQCHKKQGQDKNPISIPKSRMEG